MKIAFFGSSLVSAYWNGAATYYRGILRTSPSAGTGSPSTSPTPSSASSTATSPIRTGRGWSSTPPRTRASAGALADARGADLVVKASGVGVFDELLEQAVLDLRRPDGLAVFWDVDAPATLDRMEADPGDRFRPLVPRYDLVLTYGGGDPVVDAYRRFGARDCVPIYNALDPTTHHPVEPNPGFEGDLGFLGNRLPDREARVEEFFLGAAAELPGAHASCSAATAGGTSPCRPTCRYLGHVYTRDHNAFNCTPQAVLNVSRESMARYGFSPATRVFEAAGAGACLITDALGGDRDVPRARPRGAWWRGTATRWRRSCAS